MPQKAVHLLAVPGFADWEPAHALAEVRRGGDYSVVTVGLSPDTVESMGGLRVQPTQTIAALDFENVAIFIFPGGEYWEQQHLDLRIQDLLQSLDRERVPIAAICAATTAVARTGVIRGRRHTSNGLAYLKRHVPGYADEDAYVLAPAVRDQGLITASGVADVEFASEILAELGIHSRDERAEWTRMFRSGRIPEGAACPSAVGGQGHDTHTR